MARDHGFATYDGVVSRPYDAPNRVDLVVEVGDGTRIPFVTEQLLAKLFETLDPDAPFIIIERADQDYIQVYVDPDEPVLVEYRAGGPDSHFQGHTDDRQLAQRVLWGWATGTSGWHDLLTWEQVDLD